MSQKLTHCISFQEFERKFKRDPRFLSIPHDTRLLLFNERISQKQQQQRENKITVEANFTQFLSEIPGIDKDLPWEEVSR